MPTLDLQTQEVTDHLRKLDEVLISPIVSAPTHSLHPKLPGGGTHWSFHPCLRLSAITANLYPPAPKEDTRSISTAAALSSE